MASIQKRSNKFRVLIRRQGQNSISKTFTSKTVAQIWANKTESEIERGLYIDARLSLSVTVSALIDRYQREILPSKKAKGSSELSRFTLLKEKLGHRRLSTLKVSHITTYKNERLMVVGPASVKKELSQLSRVLNAAIKDWHYDFNNPISKIRMPIEPKGRDRRLELGEETRLLAALRYTIVIEIVCFALETAMRRSEIIAMDWSNINWDKRVLLIPDSKKGYSRTIPYPGNDGLDRFTPP